MCSFNFIATQVFFCVFLLPVSVFGGKQLSAKSKIPLITVNKKVHAEIF